MASDISIKNTKHHQIIGSAQFKSIGSLKKKNGDVYFLFGAEHLKLKNYYFDFPVVYNQHVKRWIKYFLNKGKNYFVRYSRRAGRYAPVLSKILASYGLPRDLIFLAMAESGFQNNAKSWAKAVGPWQFMPYTGKRYGLKINWYIDERRDPIKATIAACKYLMVLQKRFGSWELAAAAYNAGEGKVARAIRRYDTENFWKLRKGRYLKRETKNYVPKIMALAIIGKNLEAFGFKDIDFHEPLDFDEVTIPENSDLIKVAELIDVPLTEIQRLNPEILRWSTPLDKKYKLRLPVGKQEAWDAKSSGANVAATDFMQYKIRGLNANIGAVAKKFKIKKQVLADLNKVSKYKKYRRGDYVILPFRKGQNVKAAMYSDLYELPAKRVRRRNAYRRLIRRAKRKGLKIHNPIQFYTVRRGDTLWAVSRKTGVSLNTIIKSNLVLLKRGRMIREGDKIAIR